MFQIDSPQNWACVKPGCGASVEQLPGPRVCDGCGRPMVLAADKNAHWKDPFFMGFGVPDGYAVVGVLGRGGFGKVYLATQGSLGRLVALKVLSGRAARRPEVWKRFSEEATSLAGLQSPFVVRIIDYVEATGEGDARTPPLMVLEYLPGPTLQRWRTHSRRPGTRFRDATQILLDLLDGVAAIHASGTVHRDLKPGNVIIQPDTNRLPRATLIDLGTADRAPTTGEPPRPTITQHNELPPGTPKYMAPEQWTTGGEIGPPADLYALGIIAYELITGTGPYAGWDTTTDTIKWGALHLSAERIPLAEGADYPPGLDAWLGRALAKVPEKRFRSAAEMRLELAEILRGAHVSPGMTAREADTSLEPTDPAPAQSGLDRGTAFAGVLVACAVGVALGLALNQHGPPPPAPVVQPAAAVDASVPDAVVDAAVPDAAPPPPVDAAIDAAIPDAAPIPRPDFVRIEAGAMRMQRNRYEVVFAHDFELSRTEVTVAQYGACVDANKCTRPAEDDDCNWAQDPPRPDHPVNCVTWDQAVEYTRWLGARLPSESEWEFAARNRNPKHQQPWGPHPASCELSVLGTPKYGCGKDGTWPVCSRPKGTSLQGLCDLVGNVREWTADGWVPKRGPTPTDGSPTSTDGNAGRTVRGADWRTSVSKAGAWMRLKRRPDDAQRIIGFRVARDVPQPEPPEPEAP